MPADDRLILPGEGNLAELHKKAAKYDTLRPLCEEMLEGLKHAQMWHDNPSGFMGDVHLKLHLTDVIQRAEAALKGGE